MKHEGAIRLDEIGDLIKAVAYNIEEGNVDDVSKWLRAILVKYGDECIKWNKEYKLRDPHPLATIREDNIKVNSRADREY